MINVSWNGCSFCYCLHCQLLYHSVALFIIDLFILGCTYSLYVGKHDLQVGIFEPSQAVVSKTVYSPSWQTLLGPWHTTGSYELTLLADYTPLSHYKHRTTVSFYRGSACQAKVSHDLSTMADCLRSLIQEVWLRFILGQSPVWWPFPSPQSRNVPFGMQLYYILFRKDSLTAQDRQDSPYRI